MRYEFFSGIVTAINDYYTEDAQKVGCTKYFTVSGMNERAVNFIVTPETYFVESVMISVGDIITGAYDTTLPTLMIYPPQYQAVVMAKVTGSYNLILDHFNSQLVNSDGSLKLNISPYTKIILENGQAFTGSLENRFLTVVFGPTTRSIPAQTVPYEIIVMCRINT